MDWTNQSGQRYRIKHPWLGYFLSIRRTDNDSLKYTEKWSSEYPNATIPSFTRAKLRESMDANGNGMMALLVAGYGGLKLEEVKPEEKKRGPTLKLQR